ncbi:MAG: hypothetical protein J7K66_04045 [Anaerolineaceae bacterium]|nr:hypothetical protein [Anaerolineaceae bacterium]
MRFVVLKLEEAQTAYLNGGKMRLSKAIEGYTLAKFADHYSSFVISGGGIKG